MQPSVSIETFESIERLDELPGELGWPLQYRQLKPGPFSSTFAALDGDSWFLMEEQSSQTVEVDAASPSGMYVIALVADQTAAINGQSLDSHRVYVQGPDSNVRATLKAGVKVTQIGVAEAVFRAAKHVVAPGLATPAGKIALFDSAPGRLNVIRTAMRSALLSPASRPAIREEIASTILAELLGAASLHGAPSASSALHRAAAQRSLDRATDYIEAHLTGTIRVADLCAYAGQTLRTLERTFQRELDVSPQQYVKARRLNAARRRLLEAEATAETDVTTVAQGVGFTHLGRFAADYRRHFGESPSETLRATRGTASRH